MLSGSALTYKQERSASDLCRWYHTKIKPFKTMGAHELLAKMASLQRFGNSLSFPTQAMNCTGRRASCRVSGSINMERSCFQRSLSKPGGNASTFTVDIYRADTGDSLQKLILGKHMLQGEALKFVKSHEQAGAEQTKQRLYLSHHSLKAKIPHRKFTNSSH